MYTGGQLAHTGSAGIMQCAMGNNCLSHLLNIAVLLCRVGLLFVFTFISRVKVAGRHPRLASVSRCRAFQV